MKRLQTDDPIERRATAATTGDTHRRVLAVVMSMRLTGSSGCTGFPGGGYANGRGSVDLSLSPGMRDGIHCARRARLNRAGFLTSEEGPDATIN